MDYLRILVVVEFNSGHIFISLLFCCIAFNDNLLITASIMIFVLCGENILADFVLCCSRLALPLTTTNAFLSLFFSFLVFY